MKCPDCRQDNIDGSDECGCCGASLVHVAQQPKRGLERRIIEGVLSALAPRRAIAVLPSDPLRKAVDTMVGAKVGCVLVIEAGHCVGILSERELIQRVSETTDLDKLAVKDLMWPAPTLLSESDEVGLALHHMVLSGHLHVALKLKDGDLGIFSARDLLKYLCK